MNDPENILWQVKYLLKRNWLKARNLLLESIEKNPRNFDLKIALAEIYQSKKLYRKAILLYQELLQEDCSKSFIQFQIGNCFLSLEEFRLALNYYNLLNEDFQDIIYNKSYALYRLNRLEEAIEKLEYLHNSGIPLNSDLPSIFLAELYYYQNNPSKGLHYLNQAEKNFGSRGYINYLKGLLLLRMNNWLSAYLEFEKAEKLKVETHHFFLNFGICCERIGKTVQAIELLLQSIRLSPADDDAYIELIKLYLRKGRVIEAYSIAQLAKKNIPSSITLSLLYDQILQKIGRKLIFEKD
jgi:tetratricopeptide (TPR) repeat protein